MPKKLVKSLIVIFVFFAALVVAHFVLAATPDLGLSYGAATGLAATDPRIVVGKIIQIFLGLLGVIALGLIIYGGFLWMTAAGNEEQIDRAKKVLTSAIIGLVIILSAFGITTFILNSLVSAVGNTNNSGNNNSGGNGGSISGSGAVGACGVQNTYPALNQTGVARNSAILVTFDQPVNPATICASADCSKLSPVNASNVQIYKTSDGENSATDVKAQVITSDNKTFTFIPTAYLGTAGEDVYYTVNVGGGVNFAAGGSAFGSAGCPSSLNWQFKVSGNPIDLTPPQVVLGGVFPPPDSGADTANNSLPKQAIGSITVNAIPQIYAAASATVAPADSKSGTPSATVTVDSNDSFDGVINVTVSPDAAKAAAQTAAGAGLGAANFNGNTVSFSGDYSFTLTSSAAPVAGNEWTIKIHSSKISDSLSIGSNVYTFVKTSTAANQIAVGATTAATAQNIAAALANENDISILSTSGSIISIGAAQAGAAGNNILISSSNSSALGIIALAGGVDGSNGAKVVGAPDQPMNTVIQINFNKPILPSLVSGDSSQVKAIQVVDAAGNVLSGRFIVSNQYQTVEFISNTQCGVNGCGEPIYCLPANSHLTVKINAAALATCSSDADCATKGAYAKCNTVCQNSSGQNYPGAQIPVTSGVADVSLNSLDGNRDGNAQGLISFYNENTPVKTDGDSYKWSFYISGVMDIDAPKVVSTEPAAGSSPTSLNQDIKINFNKLMMNSTLITGSTVYNNGQAQITNKNINIWSSSGNSVGYWIQAETVLDNGTPSVTNAIIKHGDFAESVSYNAQAGSAVNDIHENCFKPSGNCEGVSKDSPSCCNGTATARLGSDGNCPSN
jgi:hypothetical protein